MFIFATSSNCRWERIQNLLLRILLDSEFERILRNQQQVLFYFSSLLHSKMSEQSTAFAEEDSNEVRGRKRRNKKEWAKKCR